MTLFAHEWIKHGKLSHVTLMSGEESDGGWKWNVEVVEVKRGGGGSGR